MRDGKLDHWTKEVVGAAAAVVRSLDHPLDNPEDLGELSQVVRGVLSKEVAAARSEQELMPGLADELAMAIYLSLASQVSCAGLSPQVLLRLNDSLSATVELMKSDLRHNQPHGGVTMRKSLTTALLLLLIALAMPRGAEAVPEFAKQWASSCASCHVGAPTSLDEESSTTLSGSRPDRTSDRESGL